MEFKKQTLLDETEKYIRLDSASKLTNESKITLTINQMAEIFERIHIVSVGEKLHESAALPLHNVINRRELLVAFMEYIEFTTPIKFDKELLIKNFEATNSL